MKVAVFGVFDNLHPGHLYFMYHARILGDELVAIVARDTAVKRLKHKTPRQSERVRMRRVKNTGLVTRAVLGDSEEGKYAVLKRIKPDIVALGYDQRRLEADIRRAMSRGNLPRLKVRKIRPFKPGKYHTSLLTS